MQKTLVAIVVAIFMLANVAAQAQDDSPSDKKAPTANQDNNNPTAPVPDPNTQKTEGGVKPVPLPMSPGVVLGQPIEGAMPQIVLDGTFAGNCAPVVMAPTCCNTRLVRLRRCAPVTCAPVSCAPTSCCRERRKRDPIIPKIMNKRMLKNAGCCK